MQLKGELERKIQAAERLLNELGPGRFGSLVDEEGFPLKDVDLYLVRQKRNEINCIVTALISFIECIGMVNDHKDVMRKIEELIPAALASNTVPVSHAKPFAKVSRIVPGSLAHRSVIEYVY